jgi:hypothetical protein
VIAEQVHRRGLGWFSRRGLLDPDDARDRLAWTNSGFSLDACVCIAGHDRAGLERRLRYGAHPPVRCQPKVEMSPSLQNRDVPCWRRGRG